MNLPTQRPQVTSPLITLSHNANASLVALYGELLTEQEKRLQILTAQLGAAQQDCAKFVDICRAKDAEIASLNKQLLLARTQLEEPTIAVKPDAVSSPNDP